HLRAIAGRLEHDPGDLELVDAEVEDGVVELTGEPQRPELGALPHHLVGGFGRRRVGPAHGDGRKPTGTVELDRDRAVLDTVLGALARKRRERDALGIGGGPSFWGGGPSAPAPPRGPRGPPP